MTLLFRYVIATHMQTVEVVVVVDVVIWLKTVAVFCLR